MNKKYLLGFTVAEVMIAMAIVGVIAAITVPTIMANYQRQTLTTQFQKNYVDLEQNLTFLQAENYAKTNMYSSILNKKDGKDIADTSGKFLKEYYQVQKDCETTAQPCFASQYASINSPSTDVAFELCNSDSGGVTVQLKDNTAICIIPAMGSREIEANPVLGIPAHTTPDFPATVYMDVNGSEPPNIGGRDMFTFQIDNFRIVDNTAETNCITSSVGAGCLNHIIADRWKVRY